MSLDGTAVAAIAKLAELAQSAEPRTVTIAGVPYSTTVLHDLRPKLATPAALKVHTLTGLIDYLAANRDALPLGEVSLHVVSPSRVDLVSRLSGDFAQRLTYATAELFDRLGSVSGFAFGQYIELERMNIALQALFAPTDDRANVLAVLGNVRADNGVQQEDDGVGQRVTVRGGVHLVNAIRVPNPVTLAPFRTFDEVEQPSSPFVLRVKEQGQQGVTAALFEADGGAWRGVAIARVAYWLREALRGSPETIGLPVIA
jgi:hypothetical protein